jgi:hypothetical protein
VVADLVDQYLSGSQPYIVCRVFYAAQRGLDEAAYILVIKTQNGNVVRNAQAALFKNVHHLDGGVVVYGKHGVGALGQVQ